MSAKQDVNVWEGWKTVMTRVDHDDVNDVPQVIIERRKIEEDALQRLIKYGPQLALASSSYLTPKRKLGALIRKLNKGGGTKSLQIVSDWLVRAIKKGRADFGWQQPFPPTLYRLPREVPLITESEAVLLPFFRRLEDAFYDSLHNIQAYTEKERYGQMLFSAVVNGGMVKPKKWVPLEKLLWSDWCCNGRLSWVCIPKIEDDDPSVVNNQGEQQWLPDQLTELLAMQLAEGKLRSNPVFPAKIWPCIRAFLHTFDYSKDLLPRSMGEFCKWASIGLKPRLPGFLSHYFDGGHRMAQLPAQTLTRIALGVPVLHKKCTEKQSRYYRGRETQQFPVSDKEIRPPKTQLAFINRLLRALYDSEKKQLDVKNAKTVLNDKIGEISFLEWLLAAWLLYLAYHGGAVESKLTLTTIKRYLSAVKGPLIYAFHDCDARILDSEEWLDRLQDAIDDTNDTRTAVILPSFCKYIKNMRFVPEIDLDELDGLDAPGVGVSANVVTPDEFEQAMAYFPYNSPDRLDRMIRLIGAIAFYCGARKTEILGVRLQDVHGKSWPELLFRFSKRHNLKRRSSIRGVPICPLMPSKWVEELMDWVKLRENEESTSGHDKLLFCLSGKSDSLLTGNLVIDPIKKALQEVTGDETIVFHHLRHSFANWFLIRLMAPGCPSIVSDQLAVFEHSFFSLASCRALRADLSFPTEGTLRAGLYQLKELLGHHSCRTSIRSYLHVLDWLGVRMLNPSPMQLPEKALQTILNKGSDWYRIKHQFSMNDSGDLWDMDAVMTYARKPWRKKWHDPSEEFILSTKKKRRVQKKEQEPLVLKDMPAVLDRLFEKGMHTGDVSMELGIQVADICRLYDRSKSLAEIKTKSGRCRINLPLQKPRLGHEKEDWQYAIDHLNLNHVSNLRLSEMYELYKRIKQSHGMRVYMSAAKEVRHYIKFLGDIGISQKWLMFFFRPYKDSSDKEIRSYKQFWCEQTGIAEDRVVIDAESCRRKTRCPDAKRGFISIGIAKTGKNKERGHEDLTRSFGIQYAILLLILAGKKRKQSKPRITSQKIPAPRMGANADRSIPLIPERIV